MNIFKGTKSWDDDKFGKVSGLETHVLIVSESLKNKHWASRKESL